MHNEEEMETQHPWDKYDVTEGDDVVVAYATGDGSVNALAGQIGCSPWDEHLMLFIDDNASVLIKHEAIAFIRTTADL